MACCGRTTAALAALRISRPAVASPLRRAARPVLSRAASTSTAPAEPVDDGAVSIEAGNVGERATAAPTYRFSSTALVRALPQSAPNGVTPLQRGSQPKSIYKGVISRVHQALRTQLDPDQARTALVDRQSAVQIPPGSVLTIETWTSTAQRGSTSFSGVLIAIRRRGLATSLVLRTLVANKLGVEMRYSLYSPLLKQIKVVARAEAHKRQPGLRRTRRAKLYYLRRDDRRLNAVAGLVKAQRQAEEAALEREAAAAAGKQAGEKGKVPGGAGKGKGQAKKKGRR